MAKKTSPSLPRDTVWLSTEAQFRAFDEAWSSASWLRKHIGRYRITPGAAYTQSVLMPWMRIPILIVASGKLDIDATHVEFTPKPRFGFGWVRRNIRSDLAFSIDRAQISAVEAYDRRSPVSSRYDMLWTRIRADCPPPLNDFYLTVGGQNPAAMSHYREQSLKLRQLMQGLKDGQ